MNKKLVVTLWLMALAVFLLYGSGGKESELKPPSPDEQGRSAQIKNPSGESSGAFPARTHSGGGVSFTVTPLNLGEMAANTMEFDISMDTHSVDLRYDLRKLAQLYTDTEEPILPLSWTGTLGGHHVEGVLAFPAERVRGAKSVTLIITDVAKESERRFVWELP